MSVLLKLTRVEAKLFLREPISVVFGILFPAISFVVLGAIPAFREPSPEFGGARFVDVIAPSALVVSFAFLGLIYVPSVVAGYREHGVLRRLATTPVHPANVLLAQLIVVSAMAVVATIAMIAVGWLTIDLPVPKYPFGFVLAFVLGVGAVLAIGLLLAAVAPTTRVATGLGIVSFTLIMFFGGVYLPRFLLPELLVRIGDYTPPGVRALLDSWSGHSPQLGQLATMVVIGTVAGLAGTKLFRWQ